MSALAVRLRGHGCRWRGTSENILPGRSRPDVHRVHAPLVVAFEVIQLHASWYRPHELLVAPPVGLDLFAGMKHEDRIAVRFLSGVPSPASVWILWQHDLSAPALCRGPVAGMARGGARTHGPAAHATPSSSTGSPAGTSPVSQIASLASSDSMTERSSRPRVSCHRRKIRAVTRASSPTYSEICW